MNDRIVELAYKVVSESNVLNMTIPPEFYEKFAELIVQECAEMVDDDGDAVMALRMMKHFGLDNK